MGTNSKETLRNNNNKKMQYLVLLKFCNKENVKVEAYSPIDKKVSKMLQKRLNHQDLPIG